MANDCTRYFMDRDSSGHWYVIPLDRASAWHAWNAIDENDERSQEAPDFAERVGGSHTLVTFSEPEIA